MRRDLVCIGLQDQRFAAVITNVIDAAFVRCADQNTVSALVSINRKAGNGRRRPQNIGAAIRQYAIHRGFGSGQIVAALCGCLRNGLGLSTDTVLLSGDGVAAAAASGGFETDSPRART